MELADLEVLDLSPGQIKVYAALLEFGHSGIQKLQEKTGLERRAIYDILNRLIERGLVSYTVESGVRSYQCTDPRALEEHLAKKQQKITHLKTKLPEIHELFSAAKPDIHAEVYRGNEAIKALLNEALEYDATYWIGGNSGIEQIGENMRIWFKNWNLRRVKKKKMMYDLVDFGTSLEDFDPADVAKHKKELYKYCTLPKDLLSPMVIIIFGNKVAQVLWSKQSFGFVLESPEVKESFMKYFDYFWKDPW